MTPQPNNPTPDAMVEAGRLASVLRVAQHYSNDHGEDLIRAANMLDRLAALTPPADVDYAEAARAMFEASRDRFIRVEQCYPAIDALREAGFLAAPPAGSSVEGVEDLGGHRVQKAERLLTGWLAAPLVQAIAGPVLTPPMREALETVLAAMRAPPTSGEGKA